MKKQLKTLKNRVEVIVVTNEATGKKVPIFVATTLYDDRLRVTGVHYRHRDRHIESLDPRQNLSKSELEGIQEKLLNSVKEHVGKMSADDLLKLESDEVYKFGIGALLDSEEVIGE